MLLLFNIVLFGFFQEATGGAVRSVLAQEGIVRKTQFPRLVIPLSVVLTTLFTLGLNMIVVFVFLFAYGIDPMWTWLLLPVILLPLVLLTSTLAMFLSALNVRFRDVAIIWTVLATALFYGTPILYRDQRAAIPHTLKQVLLINPADADLRAGAGVGHRPTAPGAVRRRGARCTCFRPRPIFVTVCVLGVWVFNREAPRIAEKL